MRRAALAVLAAVALAPAPGAAQSTAGGIPDQELRIIGANALLGGVTAGAGALLRGEWPFKAMARGAAGGAVTYVGKRVVVERWPGAGLMGRQVALVGGAMVNNAAAGRGTFERLNFAFGPVRVWLHEDGRGPGWMVDAFGAGFTIWAILHADVDLQPGPSLSSGALVFRGGGEHAKPGTIFHSESPRAERRAYVLAHERVHILQYDQTYLAWGEPIESWVADRNPGALLAHLEFNLVSLVAAVGLHILARDTHSVLWEREAIYLGRRPL